MRKAQSISINTIVVAAIALMVMILIILITTNSLGNFNRQSDSCLSKQGTCMDLDAAKESCISENYKVQRLDYPCFKSNGRDRDPDKVCCLSI